MSIYTFGCPHSGTTWLWKTMLAAAGHSDGGKPSASVYRITESNPIHPCLSDTGLHGLAMLEVGAPERVILMRIVRDPVQIFESFYAKRVKGHDAYMKGVNDDDRIYDFILNERRNVRKQVDRYTEYADRWEKEGERGWPFRLVTVHYDDLSDQESVNAWTLRVGNAVGDVVIARSLNRLVKETWMKKPVRNGRLQMGITESLLPDGMAEEIRERCS